MKYTLIITLLTLFSLFTHGQMSAPQKSLPSTTVGKIAPLGSFTAELRYQQNPSNEKDTTYFLSFRNAKYTHITSIESVVFSGIDNTVGELYKAFKSVFTDENKNNKDYLVHFTLGKDDVSISTFKNMGITQAMFLYKEAYFALTEKQIDKLFGKN